MAATLRMILAIATICLVPAISQAQIGQRVHRLFASSSNPTPTEIENHLRGYYAGNHNHGGYGYGGGAGYGFSGGARNTYNGGFFFPGYGNTYGLYPYGSGYNYSSPNFSPPPALVSPRLTVVEQE